MDTPQYDLVGMFKMLQERRASLMREVEDIDRQFLEARQLLGVVVPQVEASASPAPRAAEERRFSTCERCGREFERSEGTAGRFCSRACYEGGLSVEERRAEVLKALAGGPVFASQLEKGGMSRATIYNDLNALKNRGLVRNGESGWELVANDPPAGQEEAPDVVPLAHSLETTRTFQTLPMSSAH